MEVKLELSQFTNGDKRAVVQKQDNGYTITYYLNDKMLQKKIVSSYEKAQDLAEEYVIDDGGPEFLSE